MERSESGDLTRIKGIGQMVEKRLATAGISSLEQLADAAPDDLFGLLQGMPGLSISRVREWIRSASRLVASDQQRAQNAGASGTAGAEPVLGKAFLFTVTFDTAETGTIARTTIRDVATGDGAGWDRWSPASSIDFIEEQLMASGWDGRSFGARMGPVPERDPDDLLAEAGEADHQARLERARRIVSHYLASPPDRSR